MLPRLLVPSLCLALLPACDRAPAAGGPAPTTASTLPAASAAPSEPRPSGTFVSAILRDRTPVVCMQQVGKYDQAYANDNAKLEMQLGVTCAERGFTVRDAAITKSMFDEPDKPGNGAYTKP